jgi:hypothetical protein
MRLISAIAVAPASVVTLDSAWREAELIGRVKAERDWGNTTYEVAITFHSGPSFVVAKGHHPQIVDAIMAAIKEAIRLRG